MPVKPRRRRRKPQRERNHRRKKKKKRKPVMHKYEGMQLQLEAAKRRQEEDS